MTDDILSDLIAAIVAARADGNGVLTIAAVRARLEAAKLYVLRLEDSASSGSAEDQLRELLRKRQQQSE
jgi:hypothetical protein